MTKECTKCGQIKDITEFPRKADSSRDGFSTRCKNCYNARKRAYYKTTEGKKANLHHLKHKYGLKPTEYLEIFRVQNGKCAICGVSHLELNRRLSVDHDHATGQIRGLLCFHCNYLLGYAKDNPIILDKARQYLEYANKKWSELKVID